MASPSLSVAASPGADCPKPTEPALAAVAVAALVGGPRSASRRALGDTVHVLPTSRPHSSEANRHSGLGSSGGCRSVSGERRSGGRQGCGISEPGTPQGPSVAWEETGNADVPRGFVRLPCLLDCGRCPCGRGIPLREAERWFRDTAAELQVVAGKLADRLQQCKDKMAAKDEVITRLHWRLQGNARAQAQPLDGQQRKHSSGRARPERVSVVQLASPSPGAARQRGGSTGSTSATDLSRTTAAVARTPPVPVPCAGSFGPGSRASAAAAGGGAGSVDLRLFGGTGGDSRGSFGSASAETRSSGEAPERLHLAHLRQEIARLRRQNSELTSTVKVRSSQVDSLTGMVRDMQLSAQRQLSICRQQLDMRDDALQAMQEQLLINRGNHARSTGSCSTTAIGSSGALSPAQSGSGCSSSDSCVAGRGSCGAGAAAAKSSHRQAALPSSPLPTALLSMGAAQAASPIRRVCHVMPTPAGISSPRGRRQGAKSTTDKSTALAGAAVR